MNRRREWWDRDEDGLPVYRAEVPAWHLGLLAVAVTLMSFGLWGLFSLMDSVR